MNNYEVWKREVCNGNDLSKDFTFHYVETLNGLKEIRKKYGSVFYSKNTKSWKKYNTKFEYVFLKK